jgi:hypothetical protein
MASIGSDAAAAARCRAALFDLHRCRRSSFPANIYYERDELVEAEALMRRRFGWIPSA